MKIRVLINTPPGQARGTEKKIRLFLLAKFKRPDEMYINKENSQIVWIVEGSIKKCMSVQRNVTRFDCIVRKVLDDKLLKKKLRSKLSQSDEKKLKDMLMNHTKVEIVKEAAAQEIVEHGMTWWEKVKKTFIKEKDLQEGS